MKPSGHGLSLSNSVFWLGIFLLSAITLYSACLSFKFIKISDIAFMYYNAWLINEQGFFPYRDIMDTSFPGSFLAYSVITNLFGYSDFSFHIADTLILTILLVMTWMMMRPLGFLPALFSVTSYAAYYFGASSSMHLQRDFLVILPVVASILLMQNQGLSLATRSLLIGILFGMAIAIKPQFGIGLPVIAFGLSLKSIQGNSEGKNSRHCLWLILVGLLIYLGSLYGWLSANNASADFIDMVRNTLLPYLTEGKNPGNMWIHACVFFANNLLPLIDQSKLLLGTATAAFIWHLASTNTPREKWYSIILFMMLPAYIISTLSGLRLWDYHAMPMEYFAIVLCSLALKKGTTASKRQIYFGYVIKAMLLLNTVDIGVTKNISLINNFDEAFMHSEVGHAQFGSYLKEHSPSEKKIQLIVGNTNNPLFLILLNEQYVMATRYPLCWFCGHSNNPAQRKLELDFLNALEVNTPPTIIIDRKSFGDLDLHENLRELLADKYQKAHSHRQFEVFNLKQQ